MDIRDQVHIPANDISTCSISFKSIRMEIPQTSHSTASYFMLLGTQIPLAALGAVNMEKMTILTFYVFKNYEFLLCLFQINFSHFRIQSLLEIIDLWFQWL